MDVDDLPDEDSKEEHTMSTGIGPNPSPVNSQPGQDEQTRLFNMFHNMKKIKEFEQFVREADFDDPDVEELICKQFIEPKGECATNPDKQHNEVAIRGIKEVLKVDIYFHLHHSLISFV